MSTSYYSYIGPMIKIPKKNIDVEQRSCVNPDCYKKGKETDANFCPHCGERIGISINSVPVIGKNAFYLNWSDIPGISRHIADVAKSENMTADELLTMFYDYFITADYHIINEKYIISTDYDSADDTTFDPQSLIDICDAYKNDDLVKLFIKVLSLALQEEIKVFCGHKLYIN